MSLRRLKLASPGKKGRPSRNPSLVAGLPRHLFEGSHGLARTVTRSGAADDLCSTVEIEAVGVLRTTDAARGYQRRERNHLACTVPHVVTRDVFFTLPLLTFRLQKHTPLTSEAIELVQVETSQIGLQRLVHIRDGHTLF